MPEETLKTAALAKWTGKAMACPITITAPSDGDGRVAGAAREALQVFLDVQDACSRFDPSSSLMMANARPADWHRPRRECFDALRASYDAYVATAGVFDPRVHDVLVANGYDRSLPFAEGEVATAAPATVPAGPPGRWSPRFRKVRRCVNLGGSRVDLGGIGKGLALRWAAQRLRRTTGDFLVDAGGDCYASGGPGDDGGWLIGVESPSDATDHIAVLEVRDRACATSSIRLRHWNAGGRQVHHLIDPSTGQPGGRGLVSVTVVGADPAWAEVWSKTLFLGGPERIAELCDQLDLAALWVDSSGRLSVSAPAEPFLVWRKS